MYAQSVKVVAKGSDVFELVGEELCPIVCQYQIICLIR